MRDWLKKPVPTKKKISKKDPAVQKQHSTLLLTVSIILVLFFTGLGIVVQNIWYTASQNRIRALIIEKRNLEIELMPYIIKEDDIVQLNTVEDYARSVLGMEFPEENTIKKIIVDPDN